MTGSAVIALCDLISDFVMAYLQLAANLSKLTLVSEVIESFKFINSRSLNGWLLFEYQPRRGVRNMPLISTQSCKT